MRKLLVALFLIIAGEGMALACSCMRPGTPEDSRPYARRAVQDAVAIVEAEALSEYDHRGVGERVRVHRTLWGEAPQQFQIARTESESSASCSLFVVPGVRRLLILYPVERSRELVGRPLGPGQFRIQSYCSDFLVNDPDHLRVTLEEARSRDTDAPRVGERG